MNFAPKSKDELNPTLHDGEYAATVVKAEEKVSRGGNDMIALKLRAEAPGGGSVIIKNRYSVWIEEDGWSVDVFGGPNAPLIVAEAERSGPVTNLTIPKFCITEITDQARFNNDGLANRPFCKWADDFEEELALEGPRFQQYFGKNRMV